MGRKPQLPRKHFHRASGQWRLRIAGVDYYLGKDEATADREEERLVGEWLAAGGRLVPTLDRSLTVAMLAARWLSERVAAFEARQAAADPGQRPGRGGLRRWRMAVRRLVAAHAELPADRFTPRHFRQLLAGMAAEGLAATTISYLRGLIREIWNWGAQQALVPESVYGALLAVR